MSDRSETIAARVEEANAALLHTIASSTPEQWAAKCAEGDWTQGFAAFHAATSAGSIAGMVQALASGTVMDPISFDQIDQMNAAFHAEHSACTKDEALAAITENAPIAAATVRGLSDEQLDMPVDLAVGVPRMNLEQVIEMLLIGHPNDHRAAIEKARS